LRREKSWPEFFDTEIARLTQKDCRDWAGKYADRYSPSRFNGALQIVRRLDTCETSAARLRF